jgi:hypothetical protein
VEGSSKLGDEPFRSIKGEAFLGYLLKIGSLI